MHKYSAKRCIVTEDGTIFETDQLKEFGITDVQGEVFDSKMEAQYYKVLREGYISGLYENIERQPVYVLQDKPKIKFIPDFRLTRTDGTQYLIDVKGVQTQAFKLKLKMFKSRYPQMELWLVTANGKRWIEKKVA